MYYSNTQGEIMKNEEKQPEGRPRLEEETLAMRMNFTLPLSTVLRFRREVPDKQRSAVVAKLIERYLNEQRQTD
jgi:hypothetical protein